MSMLARFQAGHATTAEALELFDALEPVDVEFMLGNWRGEGFATGHPMDGLLEAYHWYGKRFDSAEEVHPLVFKTRDGELTSLNPALMGPSLGLATKVPMPKTAVAGLAFQWAIPLLSTDKSRARLRMTTYRGKPSATMIYDQLPINDVFHKVDDNTVFGVMDFKDMHQPFFFVLRREQAR